VSKQSDEGLVRVNRINFIEFNHCNNRHTDADRDWNNINGNDADANGNGNDLFYLLLPLPSAN